jgi:uncharacterized protein (DUF58 family)
MTYALRVVLILLALSLLAGAITGSTLYYRLAYLWAFLVISSWLMSVMSLRGIKVQRMGRTLRSQVGLVFEERYEVDNNGRFPRLWIEVRDESSVPGSHGSHVITMIGGHEGHSYLARTRLTVRGVFPLGPTVLASGDLFGMFPITRPFTSQNSLLVYPMMVDVYSFPNPPGLLPGGESLRRRTPQITSNAAGVREYEPGDPLNRIHWISTARRDRIIVKEFELDPLADVWLFVDAERSVNVAGDQEEIVFDPQEIWRKRFEFHLPPATVEYGVTIAASLARYYIGHRRAVGLVSAGASLRIVPADRGGRQLGKILESLALIRAEGQVSLQGLVEAQARHLPRGSTVVIITPSAFDEVYQTADLLLRRGLRPVVVLINGSSFGGHLSDDKLVDSLRVLGIPYCTVEKDADLSTVLSTATSFQLVSP